MALERIKRRIHIEIMPLDHAIGAAQRALKEMGRTTYTDKELSILARELQRMHEAGRLSMLRTVAKQLDMTWLGEESSTS